jgi:hypothetical protein
VKDRTSILDHLRHALHGGVDEVVNLIGYLCVSTAELATKSDLQHLETNIMSIISDFTTSSNALLARIETAIAALPSSTGSITTAEQAALTTLSTRLLTDTQAIEALANQVPAGQNPLGVPVISPVGDLRFPLNVAIAPVQIVATNSPTTYGAIGLPVGLVIDTKTGIISGTPTATGSSTVSITVTNNEGSASASVVINVQ